jgi:hypothetical protein
MCRTGRATTSRIQRQTLVGLFGRVQSKRKDALGCVNEERHVSADPSRERRYQATTCWTWIPLKGPQRQRCDAVRTTTSVTISNSRTPYLILWTPCSSRNPHSAWAWLPAWRVRWRARSTFVMVLGPKRPSVAHRDGFPDVLAGASARMNPSICHQRRWASRWPPQSLFAGRTAIRWTWLGIRQNADLHLPVPHHSRIRAEYA